MGNFKLGKLPPKIDSRTLKLASFLDLHTLPPIPESVKWSAKINTWPMFKNDEIGDCAIAGLAHLIQSWTANESTEVILPDDQVVDLYSTICHYDKGDYRTDEGCVLLDVLKFWRNTGVNGHKIEGFVSVNPARINEVKAAIYLFGGLYIGVSLPLAAEVNMSWTLPFQNSGIEDKGSWGGHCVIVVDADDSGLSTITWGNKRKMDWAFFQKYCDEAFAIFGPDQWASDGIAPNGFNIDQLRRDLSIL